MEYRVLLRQKIQVYGDSFHVELREHPKWDGTSWFHLVDIYEHCEHDRGILEGGINITQEDMEKAGILHVKSVLLKRAENS